MNRLSKTILPLGVMAFVTVALISGWSIQQLQEAIAYERQANRIQAEVDDFYQLILGAENSQRGFLLTGNPEALAQYQKAMPEIPRALAHLRRATRGLADQTNRLGELEGLVGRKIEELKLTVVLKSADKSREAIAITETGQGEELMEDIRVNLDRIDRAAKELASAHERFFRRNSSVLLMAIGLGSILGLFLVSAFAFLTRAEIRKRVRTERELRAAQEAALVASKMKSQFLATVSHEVRTPLNAIIGMSDLLRSRFKDSENRRYIEIIHGAGHALLKIVNEILDFSKIEAGKIDFEYSEFSPLELTEMNAELFAMKAREKGLSVYTYVDPEIPTRVLGDASRVSQVLRNLVSNAVKFTESGGILIKARFRFQSGAKVLLRFEVQDTGKGVAAEDQGLLFQPFNQIHVEGERRAEGTGLGLSICKELVEKMGGQVGIESEQGKGATFWFEVPFKSAAPELVGGQYSLAMKKAALISVGDCALLDQLLALYAAELHIRVSSYDSLSAVAANQRDQRLVLLDVDTIKAERWPAEMTAAREFTNSAFLFSTHGLRGDEPVHDRPSAGDSSSVYLQKPFSRQEFIRALNESSEPIEATSRFEVEVKLDIGAGDPLILVAEDNPANQIMAEVLLADLGFRAHIVANGQEVLEALTRIPYDLILMDCQMPVMDGFQATKEIRRRESGLGMRTPIIAVTANASAQDREKCFATGMDDFVSKPFERKDLSRVLTQWLKARATGPIDWLALQSLAGKTSPAVIKRMIESFMQTLPKAMGEIERASSSEDLSEIKRWAHHLRSSSALLGAVRLSEHCKSVEEVIEAGSSFGAAAASITDLLTVGQQTKEALKNQKLFV